MNVSCTSAMVRVWVTYLLASVWNDPWWSSLLQLLSVATTYWKVSLWLWKSLESSENLFCATFWLATLVILRQNFWNIILTERLSIEFVIFWTFYHLGVFYCIGVRRLVVKGRIINHHNWSID